MSRTPAVEGIIARLGRLAGALPDAVVAASFLVLWIAPTAFGTGGVRKAMLLMILEFLLLHSTIMVPLLVAWAFRRGGGRGTRGGIIALSLLTYGFFVAVLCFGFRAWWPALVFGWTAFGKFLVVAHDAGDDDGALQVKVWIVSILSYLLLAFVTLFVPLPELGLDGIGRRELGFDGDMSGIWISDPQRVLAFGMLYFAVLAVTRWRHSAPDDAPTPAVGGGGAVRS